jgi:hypothetical protein
MTMMKTSKFFATSVLMGVSVMAMASTWIPKGTAVPLTFDDRLSSSGAKAGDTVRMHVTEDVMVNGRVILKAGTLVRAMVSNVRKRGHFGVNAKLAFSIQPINGIEVAPAVKGKDLNSRTDHAAEAAGAGALILGPIGLAGGYFVVGKQIEIHPGDDFYTEVTRGTRIR